MVKIKEIAHIQDECKRGNDVTTRCIRSIRRKWELSILIRCQVMQKNLY